MSVKTVTNSRVVKTKSYVTTDGKSFKTKEQAEQYQHTLDYTKVNIYDDIYKCKTVKDFADFFVKLSDQYGPEAVVLYEMYDSAIESIEFKNK